MNFIFNLPGVPMSGRERDGAAPSLTQDPDLCRGWRLVQCCNVLVMRTWETSGLPARGAQGPFGTAQDIHTVPPGK